MCHLRNRLHLNLVVFAVFVTLIGFWWGCSQDHVGLEPPPPPPPAATEARTYDYTHSIRKGGQRALAKKFVVALVRFADDKPMDDEKVPFGPEPENESVPGPESTTVKVDVQTGGVQNNTSPYQRPRSGLNLRARDILKRELMESESFIVVERDRIIDILREQKFGESGYVYPVGTPESGQLMGVQYLIDGSVGLNEDLSFKDTVDVPDNYKNADSPLFERIFNPSKADQRRRMQALRRRQEEWRRINEAQQANRYGAYLSLYSTRTGELVAEAFGIGATGMLAVRDAVEDLIYKCREIPNPAYIVAIEGDRIVVDIGEARDVKIGQRFRYLIPGEVIRNSSGQVIGNLDEEGGEIEITQVKELMSIVKVVREVSPPVVGGQIESLE